MTDAESLLALMVDGTVGNVTAQKTLGWDDARYAAAKKELVDSGKVVLGKGRGGSLKLAGDVPPVPVFDASQFSSDEEAFLSLVPVGAKVNNKKIQDKLGWDLEKFNTVRDKLLKEKKVVPAAAGPGGGLRLYAALDLSGFASDADAVLSLVGKDTTSTEALLEQTAWEEERLFDALDILKAQNKIMESGNGVRVYSLDNPKDPVIFTCNDLTVANGVISRLQQKQMYSKTQFYVSSDEGSHAVRVRRRWQVPMSRDTFNGLATAAAEAHAVLVPPPVEEASKEEVSA